MLCLTIIGELLESEDYVFIVGVLLDYLVLVKFVWFLGNCCWNVHL